MTDQQGTDRVEREATLPADPDEVWEALTDEDRLAEWLGDDVELDPSRAASWSSATTRASAAARWRP